MDFIIIPHAVGTQRCTLWVGAFHCDRRPEGVELHVAPSGAPTPIAAHQWQLLYPPDLLATEGPAHYRQIVEYTGLTADRPYTVRLVKGAELLASATFRTLPAALPAFGQDPFTLFLGSCYYQENDPQGDVVGSFSSLPEQDRPAVKILCGDQVYLDQHPTRKNYPEGGLHLAEIFLQKYVQTWRESAPSGVRGLGGLLKQGATYFASDDHEFWNNYPNWATIIQNSWRESGRTEWRGPARYLYRQFQHAYPEQAGEPQVLDVPPLSLMILDTRFNRAEGDMRFLPAPQVRRLSDWIQELNNQRRVGFLCLGQPIFDEPGGWLGLTRKFIDRSFPDYEQYKDLVRTLATSRQPLVILTGDVHFGRVARARLPLGAELYEVISSPMSLVDPLVGGKAKEPPSTYPAEAIRGVPRVGVSVVPALDKRPAMTAEEHFLTINLWSRGPSLRMRLKYWPVRTRGQRPTPIHTVEIELLTNP